MKGLSPMANCTPIRTRRVRGNSPLELLAWDRARSADQDRQSAYIAAEEVARLLHSQAAAIRADYSFLRADDLCLMNPDGTPFRMAMAVIGETDSAIVFCTQEQDGLIWTVQRRPECPYPSAAYLAAVQARIEANRADNHASH